MTMADDPAELLDELAGLRRRARDDRHGYWFPLLLLGVLSLGAIPLTRPDPNPTDHMTQGDPWSFLNPLVHLGPRSQLEVLHPLPLSLYWLAVLVVGVVATVWWYQWRARRVGVETPTRTYVLAAVFGMVAVLFGLPLSLTLFYEYSPVYPTPLVVAIAMALLLVPAVFALRARHRRPLFVPVGLLLLSMSLSLLQVPDVDVDLGMGGMAQFTVMAFGLATLAWLERSVLCAVITAVFTATVLIVNNSAVTLPALGFAQDVLLPATVLVLGGLGALAARRGAA
ncbi:hypothetical protein [Lentzea jiangxiensis]|nr:hypothetical protein [Lentzea jiangxiensis]